jgi:hypothetical protein
MSFPEINEKLALPEEFSEIYIQLPCRCLKTNQQQMDFNVHRNFTAIW